MSQNQSKDALGDRMKGRFENRCRFFLPRRSYTILRVDGKAFHTYARRAMKPFDVRIQQAMQYVGMQLCENIQGAQFAFQQSDEVSVLITDFRREDTHAWFDNNVQKMASVAASIATAAFNGQIEGFPRNAMFDARVFTIPDYIEVENYFLWRQGDAEKNSLQMLCRSLYSHRELHGKGFGQMNEMLFAKGINWAKYGHDFVQPEDNIRLLFKRGALITKVDDLGTQLSNWSVLPCYRWNTGEGRPQLRNLVPRHWPEDFPETKHQTPKEAGPRKLNDQLFDDSAELSEAQNAAMKLVREKLAPVLDKLIEPPTYDNSLDEGDQEDPQCSNCEQPASKHSNGTDDFSKCPSTPDVTKTILQRFDAPEGKTLKGNLKAVTPDGKVIELGECEVDAISLQPILTPEMKAMVEKVTGREVVGQVEVKGTMKNVNTYPRLYQVIATGPVIGEPDKVGAVVARPDGEAWQLVLEPTLVPKIGTLVSVPFNGLDIGFAMVAKEFHRIADMPVIVKSMIRWSPKFTAN